ncbi:MAG: sigma-70 family RNA polymerase sigma factor [Crenarchaeota archaeon]|nr:MAG: sigma-70 family RNA polymerase sigma factor [Thermoproteota archaeon]
MTIIERNELIENYLPLALKLAFHKKKQVPPRVDIEDLKSAAFFGLVDAANKYNEIVGSFGAYAKRRILGEIQDFIRNSYKKSMASIDQPDENGLMLSESLIQKSYVAWNDEEYPELTDLDKNIIKMYYVDGFSMKEIGKIIGVSESRVSQLLKGTRNKLKKAA